MSNRKLGMAALALAISASPLMAGAQAFRTDAGFTTNVLPANDDGSAPITNLGFSANLFGTTYTQTFVNNNGNITFNAPLGQYTPQALTGGGVPPIIAPFFADVDTRGAASALTTYGTSTVDGHNAFGVDWNGVGYYSGGTDKLNIFQLVLVDRSDTGAGNFDFEFNYNQVQWETGGASGGSDGLGGTCAAAGFSNGASGSGNVSAQLAGSLQCGALIDGGVDALKSHDQGSDVFGRYVFQVRNGDVTPAPPTGNTTPEPSSMALLGTGLVGLVPMVRRRRK